MATSTEPGPTAHAAGLALSVLSGGLALYERGRYGLFLFFRR
jgi:hypothetical protein